MDVQKLAESMQDKFEQRTRTNGDEFVCLSDDAPDWMSDVCREAHADMLPDDWRYTFIADAIDALAEDDTDGDYLHAYVYTHDQLSWLSSRNDRMSYCDEASQDGGNTSDRIANGMYYEQREVFGLVLSALGDLLYSSDCPEEVTQ